ncbi:Protein of unknown function [Pyronema omphalodes CBS 100304]|uniref:Uncharacterized protein n=1 Tax=Pyronema omphalodes (strain CBS 100304) TaxID=1076935 RepID=U4L3D0_PYROM|nr:Protein of unknown function [Pyronema omphalodes CBS 100304]
MFRILQSTSQPASEQGLVPDPQNASHPAQNSVPQPNHQYVHNYTLCTPQPLHIAEQFFGMIDENSSVEYRALVPIYDEVQAHDIPYPFRGDRAQEHNDDIKALCECGIINNMLT